MTSLESFGSDSISERELFVLELATPGELEQISSPSEHFACLIAWDAPDVSSEEIEQFARRLVEAGVSYVCCWGNDCERIHDIFDEVDLEPNIGSPEGQTLMTTWHDDEPLSEAICFLLRTAWPDEYAEDTTNSSIAISIGSGIYAEEMRSAFKDPRAFSSLILEREDGAA